MGLVAMPTILDRTGQGRWRWYCWHCRRHGVPCVKQTTAIRRLDKHVTMKHSTREPLEVISGN